MVCIFEHSLALKKRLPGTYPFRFLTYFKQLPVVFSREDKAIIKNDYEEKGWTTYRIEYVKSTSQEIGYWVLFNVLRRFKEDGSMKRKTGSGRPINVTTDENAELIEELISSQEEFSGIHKSLR